MRHYYITNHTSYNDDILASAISLYNNGHSACEIVDILKLTVTVRSVQRWIKHAGVIRSAGDAFRLAVSKGRVKWHYKEIKKHRSKLDSKLRYIILKRDSFACQKCGRTAPICILEIDHKNNIPDDNRQENLWVLCYDCNKGKYLTSDTT